MQKNMVCTDHDILKFRRQEETHHSMAHPWYTMAIMLIINVIDFLLMMKVGRLHNFEFMYSGFVIIHF